MSNIFEKATRQKIRFQTSKGSLSVEDIWDLPLESSVAGKPSLDNVAVSVYESLQRSSSVSFVSEKSNVSKEDELRLEILKHVIEVKKAENDKRAAERANRERAELIKELIAKKETEGLAGKSVDELQAMLKNL